MIWRLITSNDVRPKYVLSGLPKSGLHLLVMMVHAVISPQPANLFAENQWIGTFTGMSFTSYWNKIRAVMPRIADLDYGHYLKGHLGYKQEIADFMRNATVAHIFIYRDFRDVVLSQAHHVVSDNDEKFKHIGKDAYRVLQLEDGFEGVISAVINGLGPFTGVMDRWEFYAPWLQDNNTLCIRYEDALVEPEEIARQVLEFGMNRVVPRIPFENPMVNHEIFQNVVKDMAELSKKRELSPTYRKAETGGWREVFTDKHIEEFKRTDKHNWLVRLGYEKDANWGREHDKSG